MVAKPALSLIDWRGSYQQKKMPAEKALRAIKRGQRVFIGSGCGEPQYLVEKLVEQMSYLADIEILHILSLGRTRYTDACFQEKCRLKSFFVAASSREAVAEGRADYTPINLSDVPTLFRNNILPVDVALIQVSPPDEHGFCSYGVAVDIVKPATECARYVIAQVNASMPRTLGDSFIHVNNIDAIVEHDEPILEMPPPVVNEIARMIGHHVAELVEDEATLRVGVGSLSSACLYALEGKKDLGVHTDMLTDPYLYLIEKGVITNEKKTLHPGKIIASFCAGTEKLYRFVHNNPLVEFHPVDYTNNYRIIAQNRKMTTIHSALEVDLSGQVCADSVGYEIYSGVGGAVDFLRGARHSEGGRSIVVLPSTTIDGSKSRIVPTLTEGSGVVTTRAGVEYVVTEYGTAYLMGKSLRERTLELINIAHPDFREELLQEAYRLNYLRREIYPVGISFYPENLEVKQLFDGDLELTFRPVRPSDETIVRNFLASLPREEPYVRFLSLMKVYPKYNVQEILHIDYRSKMVLLGIDGLPGHERVVAMGGYVLDEELMTAEVDFAVHPDYGRRGVGTFLLQRLAEIGRNAGIKTFVAYVTKGQEKVFGVFEALGYLVRITLADDVYEIRLFLDTPTDLCLVDLPSDGR
ncbi:bifunctional acetyl-CoA hydrolase/transferase family protein/GNAT family N-acetyltransferase [Thermodesulforhabdus norvegica]|uniref:Acyl-CoA hydrolase n=1 Tax=Thermodesulforhabdus norvegica TaxID=39841 RepID=A0A1I4SKT5_9BACT|nr:bifunctional acetyl-CoA hydrolase/transferase family protein/GNAT family N-acetyltransferase [Thermodesulforhabdus norvegica]SFM64883.1 Acyl-CoA hydrolase [Thermodesulforhabdus norvegica]